MAEHMLEIVDENDVVIGIAPRKEIHAKGFLHREVNVIFMTPTGELIFQRRSKTKDVCPNILDAAAAGHVEIGDSYETTALKEAMEETGIAIDPSELVFIKKEYCSITEKNVENNCFRAIFGYIYDGDVTDMQIEEGQSAGFELYPLKDMYALPEDLSRQFMMRFVTPERSADVYETLEGMIA